MNRRPHPLDDQLPLFDGIEADSAPSLPIAGVRDPDSEARQFAVDPANNVVLEASAGTGKTSVLVQRYIRLLQAGVEPGNILAITFTRKAAAEMRDRIVAELRAAASRSEADRARWLALRDRLGEIAISTIDAFCLSLLREFPLEADLEPGFEMADETEVPRLIDAALDRSLRTFVALARSEPDIALVLAQLGTARTREGLAALLERRLVAREALDRFLARGPNDLTAAAACRRAVTALSDVLRSVPGGLSRFLADGPREHPRFSLFMREVARLKELAEGPDAEVRAALDRIAAHFLTADGRPRTSGSIHPYKAEHYPGPDAAKRHRFAAFQVAPAVERVVSAFARDLNVVLARGVRRMFEIALSNYRRELEDRSVLDFPDLLDRALGLLRQMDEFAQSRFRLESRYHHVLVDEFQDTSRAQWDLVALLIQSWGEGFGLASSPSIFIVGDRKQSIYRFRDAEVSVLQEAARHIEKLRPGAGVRRSISRSFRARPELLEFVNDTFAEISQPADRADAFTYTDADRFPVEGVDDRLRGPALGIAVADDPAVCAVAVAAEIARILREDTVRDRASGVPRPAVPGDVAILFRSRASHREFERELERRGIPSYVYKGLGFFDADETKDLIALMRYLADPSSDLRAAAFLRSRFVRVSDAALARLAPRLAHALVGEEPRELGRLDSLDQQILRHVRRHLPRWIALVDRIPPADLVEQIIDETAYAYELRGPRCEQAWENVKKMRGLVRRIQNRGYATLPRIAEHLDALTAGDESNAVLEAIDAVNLMTVHAAKGLEFPIVFVVNLAKGASGPPKPIRVAADAGEESVSVGPFASEADEADREREKHESRRLLYVALTRARDRLYLSSALKDGQLIPGRGSLAEILPDSLKALFPRASTVFPEYDTIAWSGVSGRVFNWRICRVPEDAPVIDAGATRTSARVDRFGPARGPGAARVSITGSIVDPDATRAALPAASTTDALAIGTLVHRLFQAGGEPAPGRADAVLTLLTAEERAALQDRAAVATAAVEAWRALRFRPDIAEILGCGTALYEVPFSMRDGDASDVRRGIIDCLVLDHDRVVVLEFKSGAPGPAHERQLAAYVRAATAMFPDRRVEGRLVYR